MAYIKRPRIEIRLTTLDYIIEVFSILSIFCSLLLLILFWITAPDIVPTHYNIHGEIDKYGSKMIIVAFSLFLLTTNAVTYVLIKFLNKYPDSFNFPVAVTEQNAFFLYKTATRMVRWVNLLVCLLFTHSIWGLAMGITFNNLCYHILFWSLITCIIVIPVISIVKIKKRVKNNETL